MSLDTAFPKKRLQPFIQIVQQFFWRPKKSGAKTESASKYYVLHCMANWTET